jgi:predicted kinase
MRAIITVGVSASGKTTWAMNQSGYVTISRDDIRFNYIIDEYDWSKYTFNISNEEDVTETFNELVEMYAGLGKNIIIADTNLNLKYRNILVDKLIALGYNTYIKEFPIELSEAVSRDAARVNPVGEKVISRQYKQWEVYLQDEEKEMYQRLANVCVYDIDTPVLATDQGITFYAHYSGHDINGKPTVWDDGRTSYTAIEKIVVEQIEPVVRLRQC